MLLLSDFLPADKLAPAKQSHGGTTTVPTGRRHQRHDGTAGVRTRLIAPTLFPAKVELRFVGSMNPRENWSVLQGIRR
jgi:hypothetical protein